MHRHDPAHVFALATRIFGDEAAATEWFDRPSVQLGGRTPRESLATEAGALRVEALLAQIDDERLNAGPSPHT